MIATESLIVDIGDKITPLATAFLYLLEILVNAIRQEKVERGTKIGKEGKNFR